MDKDIKFTDGKVMIQSILSKVFGRDVPVRMRSGFFPFVEPGFEIDMECQVCGGKGCSVCKHVAGSRLCRVDPHIQMYFVQQDWIRMSTQVSM